MYINNNCTNICNIKPDKKMLIDSGIAHKQQCNTVCGCHIHVVTLQDGIFVLQIA